MRNVSLSFYASSLYPNVKENQTALVAKKTDTELKMYVVIKNFDLMYSEHYRVNLLFEVKAPTAHSHQIAIRISSKIEWESNSRPFGLGSVIEGQYRSKVKSMLLFFGRWAQEKLEEHDKMEHWDKADTGKKYRPGNEIELEEEDLEEEAPEEVESDLEKIEK